MFEWAKAVAGRWGGYFSGLVHDVNDKGSSKRWVLLVSVALAVTAFVANLLYRIVMDPHILAMIQWLGSIAGGGVAVEHAAAAYKVTKQQASNSNVGPGP